MVLFIRDKRDKTIVDVEVYTTDDGGVDISSTVVIEPYSKFLVENIEDDLQIIRDFGRLQELRGWFWNVYMQGRTKTNVTQQQVVNELRDILQTVANEYGLFYTED